MNVKRFICIFNILSLFSHIKINGIITCLYIPMKRMIRTIINLYHNVFVYLIEHVENCFYYLIVCLKSFLLHTSRISMLVSVITLYDLFIKSKNIGIIIVLCPKLTQLLRKKVVIY